MRESQQPAIKENIKKILREYTEALLIAVIIAIVVRTFIFSAYKIPTNAMFPTLKIGDFIIASKLSYGLKIPFIKNQFILNSLPKRGDVAIFKCGQMTSSQRCIKRIVALPGDRVQIIKKNLFINNVKADYKLASQGKYHSVLTEKIKGISRKISINSKVNLQNYGPVIIPPGHFFVLGDSRDETQDSRIWGAIPNTYLVAKAMFVWMSLDWQEAWENGGGPMVRWDRIFSKIY